MQRKTQKFNRKTMGKFLEKENSFITKLLADSNVPDRVEDDNDDDYVIVHPTYNPDKKMFKKNASDRAQSADELQARMEVKKNKEGTKTGGQKKLKKVKKLKKDKEFKKKVVSIAKSLNNEDVKKGKLLEDVKDIVKVDNKKKLGPIFNEEGKIVFSKFEFPGKKKNKRGGEKMEKDPKKILRKIKKQKKEMSELIEKGDTDKVNEIKENLAWQKAFDKTDGKKIKDDPNLLRKTIIRKKNTKKKSKTEWKKREEKVQKDIDARQKKRNENIQKKKDEKKKNKLKKMAKRGRVIPGYG